MYVKKLSNRNYDKHQKEINPYYVSPSIGLTNLARLYHVHYHLSQSDMAGMLVLP